jgi:hypothetical protein
LSEGCDAVGAGAIVGSVAIDWNTRGKPGEGREAGTRDKLFDKDICRGVYDIDSLIGTIGEKVESARLVDPTDVE